MAYTQDTKLDPRDERAAQLLATGAVTIHFDGTATVKGSGSATYRITKDADGMTHCSCPDNRRRNAVCKHLRAAKALCKLARACRAQAKETGRCRLPYLLALALRGEAASPAVEAVLVCEDCHASIQRGRRCVSCLDASLFGAAA